MSKQSEKGNVVELVIIGVLALALIGLVVWRFVDTNKVTQSTASTDSAATQKTTDATPSGSSQASTPVSTSSQPSSQSAEPGANGKYTADQVTSHVQSTYATYIELRNGGKTVQQALQAVAGAFTDSQYAALKNTSGSEGLTCASNYVPESVQVSTTISGGSAISKVTRVMNGQTASALITVVSDLSTDTITSVQCPQ